MKGNFVSYEQKERAKNVNLIDFLQSEYPHCIAYCKDSKEYVHPEHDSLKIYEKGFYRFSNGGADKGDNIRYLNEWCGVPTFQEAVLQLCRFEGIYNSADIQTIERHRKTRQHTKKGLPYKGANNNKLILYLINERGIDRETVDMLISQNVVYQDTNQNIVFCNTTDGQEYAFLRGTQPRNKFHQVWTTGNGFWFFSVGDNPKDVYITEAPIDAISLFLLKNKAAGVYCAMCGLKIESLLNVLESFPGHIYHLAPDWDDAALDFVNKYAKKIGVKYTRPKKERANAAESIYPGCKDWNGLLIAEKILKEREKYK